MDTYQGAPPEMARFATMNPFHFRPEWRIPVPGQPGMFSSSLEAVWQGLKIHNGATDFAMFAGPPVKRPPDATRGLHYDYAGTRFRFGAAEVDLVTARLLIYLPAYLHLLEHLVPAAIVSEIHGALASGLDVLFYDWDDNFDVLDPSASFSHSALLAAWFAGELEERFLGPRRRLVAAPPADGAAMELTSLDRYRSLHGQGVPARW